MEIKEDEKDENKRRKVLPTRVNDEELASTQLRGKNERRECGKGADPGEARAYWVGKMDGPEGGG